MKTKPEWFLDVYNKFKLHFYKEAFTRFQDREASLTTTETFCVDIIYNLDNPTIREFAEFADISAPNAAYKVAKLIEKGYLEKVQSETDRREYHLRVTEKYLQYYRMSCGYIEEVIDRVRSRFPEADVDAFERILESIARELTPEIVIPLRGLGERGADAAGPLGAAARPAAPRG